MAPIPVFAAIVILCIALFLLSFFSSYLRRRSTSPTTALPITAAADSPQATAPTTLVRGGLDKTVIETFQTFKYSEVALTGNRECHVCLNEFEHDETLRLIPVCRHAFHVGCIDAWLSTSATCPVCRSNLRNLDAHQNDAVVVAINDLQEADPPPRRQRKLRRALTWSKSTGRVAVNMEYPFTLRVPEEEVRSEIIAGNKLRRSRTDDRISAFERGGTHGEEDSGWRRWLFTRSNSMRM